MANSKSEKHLTTTWGAQLSDLPDPPWSEYPRPQLRRNSWKTLNGLWRCRIAKEGTDPNPKEMLEVQESDQAILVPFCLESKLGGVQRKLDPEEELWYHRSFEVEKLETSRLLLHFEAVDHSARVWVNGTFVGSHQGGFTPFEFDITEAVTEDLNHLVVRVIDATGNFQARGKQSKSPHGIWYTRVSGIWQTVWLETVPTTYISDLRLHTERLEPPCFQLQISVVPEASDLKLRVVLMEKENKVLEMEANSNDVLKLELPGAKLWSPESPHLYDLQLQLLDARLGAVDSVQSYVGIRSVGKQQDEEGHWRMTLNGEICFHLGPLDQGWWPDGLLTAPSDEAMRSEIEFLKEAGFNMIRKHVKLEPRRYYYHCDVLGIMVWQDQASATEKEGDCFKVPPWTRLQPGGQDAAWPDWARKQFLMELKEMVDTLHNSPAVVVWVPFNEAWGQHDTLEIAKWLQAYDPSRLLNIASGGNFFEVGDIVDHHNYPEATFPMDERFQPFIKVVGEFGGHGLVLPEEHLWQTSRKNWGYDVLKDTSELEAKYANSIQILGDWMQRGIAAGVYTQTTDVECEVNGLLSYDRKVQKLRPAFLAEVHHRNLWSRSGRRKAGGGGYQDPVPSLS